jgi:hypothetical protein
LGLSRVNVYLFIPEVKRTEEVGTNSELQSDRIKRPWKSVRERIAQRKDQGQQKFRRERKWKNREEEQKENSRLIETRELAQWWNKRYPFGLEPPPEPGTLEWDKRKDIEGKAQALDLLGIRSRLACSEKSWPGAEQRKIPGNKRAIQKMIAVNPVFKEQYFNEALEDPICCAVAIELSRRHDWFYLPSF